MRERRVTLFGVHLELSHGDLMEALEIFGKVTGIQRQKIPNSEILSGKVVVMIELKSHIPSDPIMAAQQGLVSYAGQSSTCFACRKVGPQASQCEEKKSRQMRSPKERQFRGNWTENPKKTMETGERK